MRFLNAHDQYLLQGSDLMIESNEETTQSLNVYIQFIYANILHFSFLFWKAQLAKLEKEKSLSYKLSKGHANILKAFWNQ